MKKINKKSEVYKQGFIDGYTKARKDFIKIKKRTNEDFKLLKENLNKLRKIRLPF